MAIIGTPRKSHASTCTLTERGIEKRKEGDTRFVWDSLKHEDSAMVCWCFPIPGTIGLRKGRSYIFSSSSNNSLGTWCMGRRMRDNLTRKFCTSIAACCGRLLTQAQIWSAARYMSRNRQHFCYFGKEKRSRHRKSKPMTHLGNVSWLAQEQRHGKLKRSIESERWVETLPLLGWQDWACSYGVFCLTSWSIQRNTYASLSVSPTSPPPKKYTHTWDEDWCIQLLSTVIPPLSHIQVNTRFLDLQTWAYLGRLLGLFLPISTNSIETFICKKTRKKVCWSTSSLLYYYLFFFQARRNRYEVKTDQNETQSTFEPAL